MKNSKKDLDNMLKLDSIDWAEVVEALDPKEGFRDCDIKRALKKTGRSFNYNGPFHATVRNFIKYLGSNVKVDMIEGERVYTLTGSPVIKKKPVQGQKTGLFVPVTSTVIGKFEAKKEVVETKDEDKIKDLFNRSYSRLSEAIKLLAIFIKYESKKVPGEIIKNEFGLLGVNYLTYLKLGRPATKEIFDRLGLFTVNIQKNGSKKPSDWILSGDGEVLEAFMRLQEIYKNLSGVEHENLDDYISTKKLVVQPKTWEDAKKVVKQQTLEIDRTETTENRWKKWLLLEALKNRQGAASSIESLVGWIKSVRYTEIDKNEAIKLFREMQNDSGCIKFTPGDCVSYNGETVKVLFKLYDPKKITENVYVKVRMTPEEMGKTFSGMMFNIDEALEGGKYIYKIHIDRSYQMEVNLKKLLRIIQISGAVYSTGSFMISRVSKILEKEDSERNSKEQSILILENI